MPARIGNLTADESAALAEGLDWLRRKDERQRCEGSLIEFMRCAWPHMGESGEFEVNWHHIKIADHLESVARGECRATVVNQPPRTTKTLLISVAYPSWLWAQPPERQGPLMGPHVKFFCLSYGATLAEEIAVKMRRLVMGEWYQGHWGDRVTIRPDQQNRANFANTAGGERLSNSIEGGILGRGGDIQICFPADEVIWTENGPCAIGDIVATRSHVRVWSYSDTRGCLELRPLIGWHRNPGSPIIEVYLDNGMTLRCTPNHRLMTASGGWVRADALIPGDELRVAIDQVTADQRDGFVGDTEVPGEAAVAIGALPNFADLLVRHLCARVRRAACAAIGLFNIAKMTPVLATAHAHNGCLGYAYPRGEHGRWLGTRQSFHGLRGGHRRATTAFAHLERAVAFRVLDILLASSVFQAGQRGLSAVAVDVPNLLAPRAGAKKCQRDEAMHLPVKGFSVAMECDPRVSLDDRGRHHLAPKHVSPVMSQSRERADPTEIGNFVAGEICDREPSLGRVRSTRLIGHVDATYCVTVEGNHNMVMGAATIVTSNCDDPHSTKGVESLIMRQSTIDGMRSLSTRITDPRRSARILVMQRLHGSDATDYALKNWGDDLTHIMLPMRFDSSRACDMDIRQRDGQLLWPEVFTDQTVRQLERELMEYGAAGQLQQLPIPRGGGIIKWEWLQPWPPWNADDTFPQDMVYEGIDGRPRIRYPALEYVVGWVDTAYTEKQQNDPSAMIVLGVFRAEGKGRIEPRGDGTFIRVADDYGFPKVLLLAGWQKRLELHGPPEEIPAGVDRETWAGPRYRTQREAKWGLVEWVADTCKRFRVDHLGIETQAQGHGLDQELRRLHGDLGCNVELVPARGDKWARLYAVSHLFSSLQVYVPTYEDGTHPTWCDPLLVELCLFPRAEHDEAVDCMSGGLKHLRDTGILERREEFDRSEERSMAWPGNKPVGLPYPL